MTDRPTQTDGEWTIGRLLAWTRQHFDDRGIEDARLCSELLLSKALECEKIALYARINDAPSETQRAAFRELVKAAAEHQPIAYLIGRKEFYSLDFIVTPDVLIPRPETELLVEQTLAWCDDHRRDSYQLLDVGTGSGCIAVTLVKRNAAVRALASDISEAALAVAKRNAEHHGVADRISFVQADMLDLPSHAEVDSIPEGGFDVIVSNPPYVAEHERERLPRNVRDYEPNVALVSGGDGLTAYRRIAADVGGCLRPGGTLLLEIGEGQADEVEAILTHKGRLEPVARHKDLAGIERALQFTMPA